MPCRGRNADRSHCVIGSGVGVLFHVSAKEASEWQCWKARGRKSTGASRTRTEFEAKVDRHCGNWDGRFH